MAGNGSGRRSQSWRENILTLKMTTAAVVETSVTVNNNSPIQDNVHPDDQTQPTFEMTSGFKHFTKHRVLLTKVAKRGMNTNHSSNGRKEQ